MIRVYIKEFIGEFENETQADDFLTRQRYNFDEFTQPVFEEVSDE
jgi:hypothetical protein